MRLVRAKLINIKSYYPEETIFFEKDINIFVGPNSGGKSNLFEAIQGAINNIIFKHISLPQNQNLRSINHPDIGKPYSLTFDQIDQNNIINNIVDRHFSHSSEPGTLQMVFQVSKEDISLLDNIIEELDRILIFLKEKVTNSGQIISLLESFSKGEKFNELIGKEIILDIYPHNDPTKAIISDLSNFTADEQTKLQKFYNFIQYSNVFYELSNIFPKIKAYPMIRYFGPSRSIGQPQSENAVDLSSINNYEENYSKNTNLNKDNTPSYIDGSFNKLAYLYRTRNNDLINKYKNFLEKYLNLKLKIKKDRDFINKYYYIISFNKKSGLPMKLSSGEKEFFNLISGLILTGIKNGIVLMDEPELHLHSQWQQVILELIYQLSSDFNIQFLIVTHSPKLINQKTLPDVFRVYMDDSNTSHIVKPKNPVGNNEQKDLIQFINTTNNEKAFFANKVILVEGISDLIVYSEIVRQFKEKIKSDNVIEIIEVGSKNNLIRFRKLLNEWEIDNYIIADLDYLREIRNPSEKIILKVKNINDISNLSAEIATIIKFSEKKLKEILIKKVNTDNLSLVDLILNKKSLTKKTFNKKINELTDYIINERALSLVNKPILSKELQLVLKVITDEEKILLIKEGDLERLFTGLCKKSENKVKNAIEVGNKIKIDKLPKYISKYFSEIVK